MHLTQLLSFLLLHLLLHLRKFQVHFPAPRYQFVEVALHTGKTAADLGDAVGVC